MTPSYRYDPESDAAYLRFSDSKIHESAELSPGVIVDYDIEGKIVAFEILGATALLPEDALAAA